MQISEKNCSEDVRFLIEKVRRGDTALLEKIELKQVNTETLAEKLLIIIKWLKNEDRFTYAQRLLKLTRDYLADLQYKNVDDEDRQKLRQEHALCTYKDADMATEQGLAEALKILESDPKKERLRDTENQETLGLAGSIHKRMWEVDLRKRHLERSLFYYERGYAVFCQNNGVDRATGENQNHNPPRADDDNGYTSINAAFVLDLLADMEETEASTTGSDEKVAEKYRTQALLIRQVLSKILVPRFEALSVPQQEKSWWLIATIAEAYFGSGNYDEAGKWIDKAHDLKAVPDWELETFARQLASVARVREKISPTAPGFDQHEAVTLIKRSLGSTEIPVTSRFIGKVGLALSGGGFRSALFHIGVLAKLAEFDVLRHVEVISCVSGGSIIGAHYYLGLKQLLEKTPNPDRDAYCELVDRVLKSFIDGVKANVRVKALFKPWRRTERAAEILEEAFFDNIDRLGRPHNLADLLVSPAGTKNFTPVHNNWSRDAKVPTLIINATSLNTGHNWQFTATWMGEPPAYIEKDIDANYRLRRMYFEDEAPRQYEKGVSLARAVAASACVPAIFKPIALKHLYQNITVRLVDGGVKENQGVFGLLQQNCDVLLVSDGSGQMDAEDDPAASAVGVPFRSNDITMKTVRIEYYKQIVARSRMSRLRESMYLHLKLDLGANEVDWDQTNLEPRPPDQLDQGDTEYGISKAVQRKLAGLRTDLDKFSHLEMFGLMLSGYKMTEKLLPDSVSCLPLNTTSAAPQWPFLELESHVKDGSAVHDSLVRYLDVGKERTFRGFRRWWRKNRK